MSSVHTTRALAFSMILVGSIFATVGAQPLPDNVPDPLLPACGMDPGVGACDTANSTLQGANGALSSADPVGAACSVTQAPCDLVNQTVAEPVATACATADACATVNTTLASATGAVDATCHAGHQSLCAAANQTIADAQAGHAGPSDVLGVVAGACADSPSTCSAVTSVPGTLSGQVNATCDAGHRNLCAAANQTIGAPGAQDIPLLVAAVCADAAPACATVTSLVATIYNTVSDQVNHTLASTADPVNATCDAHRTVCAAVNESIVDLQNVNVTPTDPDHTIDDVRDPVQDLIAGVCADGSNQPTCDLVNGQVLQVISAIPNVPDNTSAIKFIGPQPGDHNNSSVLVTIETTLPATAVGPAFWLEYAAAGTGDWRTGPGMLCPGNGDRQCSLTWKNLYTGEYTLRMSYGSRQSCLVNQCATLGGNIFLDHVAPVSRVTSPNATLTTLTFPLTYTVSDDTDAAPTVRLLVQTGGSGPYVDSGLTPAGGAFTFTAPGPGTYAFQTIATDASHNVEQKGSVADATVTVVTDLSATVKQFFVNGETLSIDACVLKGTADLTTGTVTADFDGTNGIPLAHGNGCHWTSDPLGTVAVSDITNKTVVIHAVDGDALGDATLTITESPARLVYVSLTASNPIAPSGTGDASNITFSVQATFADTGGSANMTLTIADENGTLPNSPIHTNGDGKQMFNLDYATAGTHTITATAISAGLAPDDAPVSAAPVTQVARWTQIVASYSLSQDPSNDSDVGAWFDVRYCVDFADGGPVDGAAIDVLNTTDGATSDFASSTDASGCGNAELNETTVAGYDFAASFTYNVLDKTLSASIPAPLRVNFTRVDLTIAVDDSFVNVGDVPNFTVTGVFEHDPSVKAVGAQVQLVSGSGGAWETATLEGSGSATIPHQFAGVFNDSVTAVLLSTLEHVTKSVAPSPNVTSMIATRVVVGAITAPDLFVNLGDTVHYTVPLTWQHDASPIPSGTVTLSYGPNAQTTCNIASGSAACDVTEPSLFADVLNVSVATPQGVSLIKDAPAQTPKTVWTQVGLVANVTHAVVAAGTNATILEQAVYLHDGSPVPPGFTVHATDGCGLDQTLTSSVAGLLTVYVSHDTPCESFVHLNLGNTTDGITSQSVPDVTTNATVGWTVIGLDGTPADPFVTIGDTINVTGNATYEGISTAFGGGTVTVTGDQGQALGTGQIVGGVLTATLTNATTYVGNATFTVTSDDQLVGKQLPFAFHVTWTRVLLDATPDATFVAEGDTIHLTGHATYEGVGPVASGTVSIINATGATLATVAITNGAWSADVSEANTYSAPVTVRIVTDDQDVGGADIQTPTLTFTHIDLGATAPSDLFVNATSTMTFHVTATYAHGPAVTNATITAFEVDNSTVLGSCSVTNGACDLALATGGAVYDGLAVLKVTAADHGVVLQSPSPVYTAELVWTKLIVVTTHAAGPLSTGSGAEFTATVTYAHNGQPVPGVIVTIGNLSSGPQQNATDASGHTLVDAIETAAGTRTLSVTAYDPTNAIGLALVDVPSPSVRWTAIGFQASNFTYDPAPVGWTNGQPVWRVNTAVTVCGTAVTVDDGAIVPNANLLLRGVPLTADANGVACLHIAPSSSPRNLSFTGHAVDGLVAGVDITSSVDLSTVLHFVASP